jgi:hypothetical protein
MWSDAIDSAEESTQTRRDEIESITIDDTKRRKGVTESALQQQLDRWTHYACVASSPLYLSIRMCNRLSNWCVFFGHKTIVRSFASRSITQYSACAASTVMSAVGAGVQGAQQRNQEATVWVGGLDDQVTEGEHDADDEPRL